MLFLNLNNLKRINDRYGHMVGNRALCRVSEVLQLTSRNIDTDPLRWRRIRAGVARKRMRTPPAR